MSKRNLNAWWCECGPRYRNFGDKLTKLLIEHFTKHEVTLISRKDTSKLDMIGVGSILHVVKRGGFRGKIWTTGFMQPYHRGDFTNCNVIAVRGKLTLSKIKCKNKEKVIIGDGGLLCDQLYPKNFEKQYVLGIIPHFIDSNNEQINKFIDSSSDIVKIDICDQPPKIVEAVKKCQYILSSSLHGVILADSLNIPNDWIQISNKVHGKGFKFRDHYSIFNINNKKPILIDQEFNLSIIVKKLQKYERPGIEMIKEKLKESISLL